MKTALSFIILVLITSYSYAQKVDQCPSGQQRFEVGVTLNTPEPSYPLGTLKSDSYFMDGGNLKNNTIAFGVLGKYFLNDNNNEAFRLRFVYTNKNISARRELWGDPVHSIYDFQYTQNYYKISPGFQWTIGKNRISLFGGIELPFTIIGKNTQRMHGMNEEADPFFFEEDHAISVIDGGYSVGAGLFFGSNYFLTPNMAIGFDLSAAYLYTSVGGKIYVRDDIYGKPDNIVKEFVLEDSIKEHKFSPIQGAINLTFKF
jgi:hypothetical protein